MSTSSGTSSDAAAATPTTGGGGEQQQDENNNGTTNTQLLRQKLMESDEVYLYKIPPLKGASGHRAEDWNLANPLQTCKLLVERRGDVLVLDFFTLDNNTNTNKLFAQSVIDLSQHQQQQHPQQIQHWLEQVVDSSRYFTLKISSSSSDNNSSSRTATIGFGFRNREEAVDLREAVQYYQDSLRREREAATAASHYTKKIPQLAKGEKIHVNVSSGSGSHSKKPKKTGGGTSAAVAGKVPLLLKKPPPSPDTAAKQQVAVQVDAEDNDNNPKALQSMRISMGSIDLDAEHDAEHENDYEDDSSCAVADEEEVEDEVKDDDDEDDWDTTEFASAGPPPPDP